MEMNSVLKFIVSQTTSCKCKLGTFLSIKDISESSQNALYCGEDLTWKEEEVWMGKGHPGTVTKANSWAALLAFKGDLMGMGSRERG